jgi:hypothetical protein
MVVLFQSVYSNEGSIRPGAVMRMKIFYIGLLSIAACTVLSCVLLFPSLHAEQLSLELTLIASGIFSVSYAPLPGNESGQMEGWVYPLKIFRNSTPHFTEGWAVPAESLVRTLIVRPESATLVYAGDNFSVRETFFVPVHERGAVILLDVETEQPIEIEAGFVGDFQLEWPAAVGGTFHSWDESQHAYIFGEEQKKFSAMLGSPSAPTRRSPTRQIILRPKKIHFVWA